MADPYADIASPDPYADISSRADEGEAQPGAIMGALRGASRGLEANLPFVDRAVAAAKGGDYAANLATERAKNEQFAQDNPWTNAAAGLVASAPLATVGGPTFGLGGMAGRAASAALPWAAGGATEGASSSPDLTNIPDTAKRAAIGGAISGTVGAVTPPAAWAVGKAISPLAAALSKGPGPADVAKLGGDVSAAYENVKNLGAAYPPEAFKGLTDKIAADAADADIDPGLNPKASAIIANLQARAAAKVESGQAVTLPELDKMRQFVNDNLTGLPEAKQARFGSLIRGNIDDFIKNASPEAMVGKGGSAPNLNPPTAPDANYVPPGESGPLPSRPVNTNIAAPPSLVSFLSRMGVKDEGGDLASMGFTKFPGLVRPLNGVPMDEARRAAAEAGYLDHDTTVDDLLDKIANHPTYARGADEEAAARRGDYRDAMAEYRQAVDEARPSQIAPEPSAVASQAPDIVPPAPSVADASNAIQTARNLAMRQFKAQALAKALSKAEIAADTSGTGGNIENATRQRLARIIPQEPWSPDEAAQLNKMTHGTLLTNTLRQVGRFGPKGNALMAALELASGRPPVMAAALGGTGAQIGEGIARRAGQGKLLATILAGGQAPAARAVQVPDRAALAAALAARQPIAQPQSKQQ